MNTAALVLSLVMAALLGADEPPPRTRVANCTTSGCHAREMDHKFLHGPTAVSACDACHEYQDPVAHTFTLKRQGLELCVFCHIDKKGTAAPVVHKPFSTGECTACHDPHGAHTRELLRKPTVNELCVTCHTTQMAGSVTHRPAAERCTACHSAHTSEHPALLTVAKRDLCLSCHKEVAESLKSLAHPHKPAEGDCLQCHSPHSSNHIGALHQDPKDLCISCHSEVGRTISAASHPHSATSDARACLNCHSPHASDHAKQLIKDPIATCLECHRKPIVVDANRTVPGVPELAAPNMHLHGPVKDGDCSACHTVHGGALASLLIEPYPASFYQTFTDQAYALCFKCHDAALVQPTAGDKPTEFRDGARNLHAVHVNGGPQGRSCRACHAVHASRFETLLADTVTFGQWKLPLNYVKTPTGGSCAPGCHKPQSYDRERPAAVPAPGPAASPAEAPPAPPAQTPISKPPATATPGPTPPPAR